MNMSATVGALNINVPLGTEVAMREGSGGSALLEFERIYRNNVGVVTAFFARRCSDPQTVADLTSETIVRAAAGFAGFDPRRGTPRRGCPGSPATSTPSTARTRRVVGMR